MSGLPYLIRTKDYTKKIRGGCPACLACCDDIAYQNSGPIVRVYCTKCGLAYTEEDALKNGFNNVIDFWNNIGN